MRIYLDVCCLSRPFDDLAQSRVKLEAESVLLLFRRFLLGTDTWIISDAIYAELNQNRDIIKRDKTWNLFLVPHVNVPITLECYNLSVRLSQQGLKVVDSLHVAIAEIHQCDFFLTTDDRLIRKCGGIFPSLKIKVRNPCHWFQEIDNYG